MACWSTKNQLKPTAAEAGSSFTGYEEGVVPVNSRGDVSKGAAGNNYLSKRRKVEVWRGKFITGGV